MKITFGYAKDLLACFMFVFLAMLIYKYDAHHNKNFVLMILFLALLTDGLFSVFPTLHNTPIREEHFGQPFLDEPHIKSLYESEFLPLFAVSGVVISLFLLCSLFGYMLKRKIN